MECGCKLAMDPDKFQMRDIKRRLTRSEKTIQRLELAIEAQRVRLSRHLKPE